MNILHLNDLHLKDPDSVYEALRKAFYLEYLESLIDNIKQLDISIDCLIITGDFVEKAEAANYEHAGVIIRHFIDTLKIPEGKIFLINGNHDISRDTGDLGPFKKFASQFLCKDSLIQEKGRYSLCRISGEVGVLCLDSIGNLYATGKPSPLSTEESDEIVTLVREQKFHNLLVLSHHPAESYSVQNQGPFDEGNPDWSGDHIWHSGGALHKRLSSSVTISEKSFWFAGDLHRPELCLIDQKRFIIVTGRLNFVLKTSSHVYPQARVICLDDIKKSYFFQYELEGHEGQELVGSWVAKNSIVKFHGGQTTANEKPTKETSTQAALETIETTEKDSPHTLQLVDLPFEKKLYEYVLKKGLYEFGRYDTNSNVTSLSWISTHKLMENYSDVFSGVVKHFRTMITSTLPEGFDNSKCLLVGVDSWGSILASRVGAAINIRSCSVAVRSQADSYDSVERINEDLKKIVRAKEIVFVISDVISTGRSISTIREQLNCSECAVWYNLAIFCDPSQDRGDCFLNYTKTFFCCGTVKMPIIHNSKLPDHEILKASISFVR